MQAVDPGSPRGVLPVDGLAGVQKILPLSRPSAGCCGLRVPQLAHAEGLPGRMLRGVCRLESGQRGLGRLAVVRRVHAEVRAGQLRSHRVRTDDGGPAFGAFLEGSVSDSCVLNCLKCIHVRARVEFVSRKVLRDFSS